MKFITYNSVDVPQLTVDDLQDLVIDWNIGGSANPLGQVANFITETIGGFIYKSIGQISTAVGMVVNSAISGVNAILSGIRTTINTIYSSIASIIPQINSVLSGISSTISRTIGNVISGLSSMISTLSASISSGLSSVINSLNSGLSGIRTAISGIVSQISSSISGVMSTISGIINQIGSVLGSVASQIIATITSSFNQFIVVVHNIATAVSQTATQFGTIVTNALASIGQTLGSIGAQIIGGFTTAFNTLWSVLKSSWEGFTKTLNDLIQRLVEITKGFSQWLTEGFLLFTKDPFGFLKRAIDEALKALGFPTIGEIYKTLTDWWNKLKFDASKIFGDIWSNLQAWFKDPIGKTKQAVNETLEAFGLPTLDEISTSISDWWNSTEVQNNLKSLLAIPEEVMKFIKLGTRIFEAFLEEHSPSVLENLILTLKAAFGLLPAKEAVNFWEEAEKGEHGLLPSWYASRYNIGIDKEGKISYEPKEGIDVDLFSSIKNWFNELGKNIVEGFQAFAEKVQVTFINLGNWAVDSIQKTFNLPAPDPTITDPFGKFSSMVFKSFEDIAKKSTSSTPITITNVLTSVGASLPILIASEGLEALGTMIDIAHPMKPLGLQEKFGRLVQKVGVYSTSQALGDSLAISALHPVFTRYFRKLSQVDIPDRQMLVQMYYRKQFDIKVLNEYLSETGWSENFRKAYLETIRPIPAAPDLSTMVIREVIKPEVFDYFMTLQGWQEILVEGKPIEGMKISGEKGAMTWGDAFWETHWRLPAFEQITESYARFIAEGKISREQALIEIGGFIVLQDFRPFAREVTIGQTLVQMSFTDKELVQNLIARYPTRIERRFMRRWGLLTIEADRKFLIAENVHPDYIKSIQDAETYNMLLEERTLVRSRALTRYMGGYIIKEDFTKIAGEIRFQQLEVEMLVRGAELDIQTTLDELRLKEAETDYTQGFTTEDDYSKALGEIIKNEDIRKQKLAIAKLSRKRFDKQQIRNESDKVIGIAYNDLTEGAIQSSEFTTIAKSMDSTDEEIRRLIEAAKLSLKAKIRIARFRTFQTQLARGYLSVQNFVNRSLALPIDKDLIDAAKEKIIAQVSPKQALQL